MDARSIAEAITCAKRGGQVRLRQAVIASVQGSTYTLRIAGSTVAVTGIRKFAHVGTLVANDTVWIIADGSDAIILGKIA